MAKTMTLLDLLDKTGISQKSLAIKMKMPRTTFKNKLSKNTPQYHFSEDEEKKVQIVIKGYIKDLNEWLKNPEF
jgi:hypothetical protein